ncbi:MAG: hypothetical protein AABY78_10705 [Nitrospirota bacterium]|jgi:hypothetical protein
MDRLRRFYYFLSSHKYDLITAVSAVILLQVSESNELSAIIILLSAFVVIYLQSRDRDFYFISMTREQDKYNWIGKGIFEYERTHNCFSITNSGSGHIYSKCLAWSDYEFSFNFKIIKDCLGAIVRAVNLSNYVMLQIRSNGIRPHIRINGGWKPWESEEAKLNFTESLSLDKWYKCVLTCNKGVIDVRLLDDDNPIFERQWDLPKGSIIFKFKKEDEKDKSIDIPFPINLAYGSIGFRLSKEDKKVYLYYAPYSSYFLCVVCRHLNGDGFIITAYLTDKIKKGVTIYETD